MDLKSTFGTEPERIDRLLSMGLEDSSSNEAPDPTASLDFFTEKPGGQIGRYKLLNVLGEGGMGIVYLAEQVQPIRRKVALKVVKPGMDSKRVIARFEAERQALALLDHPNIAHVHDAGTTENGRPYFVMEYVKGLSITEHCDRHKLTIEDRLNLFRQVCHAVHHAHQKGIIHRDIKPSNILISTQDDEALPKIIDFGVAKALAQPLTERTLVTEQGQLFGTPEYMSPEQADMANEDIDTRSDIYSLGVLLYVLLTGVLPFDSTTFREGGIEHIRQVIREADPKTPSTRLTKLGEEDAKKVAESRRTEIATLAKKLHKELEWIPLKAMRKERSERYRSASEFADDIDNYLKGDPLIAGPTGTGYKLKKFVRRNSVLVGGIATVLVVLVAGVIASTFFAIRAERARAEAQAIADFLQNGVEASTSPEQAKGTEVSMHDLLTVWSKKLEGRFDDKPLIEASIRDTLGWAYRNISEPKAAEPHLERALQIRQEHLGLEHPQTMSSMDRLAWLRWDQGRYVAAAELLKEALSTSRRVLGSEHDIMLSLANTLGCVYIWMGRYDEAEQLYLKGVQIARRVLGEKNDLSITMVQNIGQVYEAQGRYDEAERHFLEFLETLRLRDGVSDDENVGALVCKSFLARVYMKQKRYPEAKELYLEILPIQRRVNGREHWRTLRSVNGLARVHTHLGEHNEADKLFTEELQALQRAQRKEHPDMLRCMNGLAELYTAQRRFEEAESLLIEALEISSRTLGEEHPWTLTTMNNLAAVYKEQARYDEAESLLLESLEGRRKVLGEEHPDTLVSLKNLIELYEACDKPEKAEEWREADN